MTNATNGTTTHDEYQALLSESSRAYLRDRTDFYAALYECPDIDDADWHENNRQMGQASLSAQTLRTVRDYAPTYFANKAAAKAAEEEDNRPPTAQQLLAALEDRVRAGEAITPAELATARADATAEADFAALAEEGAKARAKVAASQAKTRAAAIADAIANPPKLPVDELAEAEAAAITAIDRIRALRREHAATLIATSQKLLEAHVEPRLMASAPTDVFDEGTHPHGPGHPAAVYINGELHSTDPMEIALRHIEAHANHKR